MDDEMMPFPSEDTTPPVTNMYFVSATIELFIMYYCSTIKIQSAKLAQKYELGKQLSVFILTFANVCELRTSVELSGNNLSLFRGIG